MTPELAEQVDRLFQSNRVPIRVPCGRRRLELAEESGSGLAGRCFKFDAYSPWNIGNYTH